MKIGHVLKLVRTGKAMTQKDMADLLGVSQNYLSLIEIGSKAPSSEKLAEFAKSMSVSEEALVFVSTDVPEELSPSEKEDFLKLQYNILSLLLFKLTGELRKNA